MRFEVEQTYASDVLTAFYEHAGLCPLIVLQSEELEWRKL